jgi:hypothetical protein
MSAAALTIVPWRVPTPPVDVEIVVPVYNEEHTLRPSIERLHEFLSSEFPLTWQIVIADNASHDGTLEVAQQLSDELEGVHVLHLQAKGRGRALRAAWLASPARVVCYMDADLSTDLRGLLPLVAPLISGHSDLAIGTRLARSARVHRGTKRELISRAYNLILRRLLRARFSDAQCGFKAVRTDVARRLLPAVVDQGWFFDTELLVLAQHQGLRIHEVPVDWVDDPDSRVDIVPTAMGDLRGVARLLAATHVLRFAAIGVLSTLALTGGALFLLHTLDPRASRAVELIVLIGASVTATVTRYLGLRLWVFSPSVTSAGCEARDQLSRLERNVELRRVSDAVQLDPVGVRQPGGPEAGGR